ncbi:outer membrane protein assembly factor BamB family protein [Halobacterium sp. KA-6]|uniref:outer membrane protein assembly factor BamB family protein n=1 Tax=Halobacterium sp. KA-6 TaxID=2896368 RepID=UPI001E53CF2B|nr:PQQ-binding-like beta-propeller repeat protein [Halobacterium sp. KA-6]MCD2204272.1 transcriptional regulator [Halobacterium sp. KA-6]
MPSRQTSSRAVELGGVQPNGSRQLGRRSSVCLTDDGAVAGLADGTVAAYDGDPTERWRNEADDRGSVVALAPFADGVLAGERGVDGEIRLHDADTGNVRWRYRTADDVGDPERETRFYLPFVADVAVSDGGERAFVAARRYERGPDGGRNFRSAVYAFEADGSVAWRFAADASPISLAADGDRVAVAYNRCPGHHGAGLVVLDAYTGEERRRWDPPGGGDRRVGDVALAPDGFVAASHADYRGYRIDGDGVRWAVDLGRPVDRGHETVYTYPNHVHATAAGALFVTGNTYPEEGRETDARHPSEHTAVGVAADGEQRFADHVGGFAHETAIHGDRLAVPVAQHFRERDPARHGVRVYDVEGGRTESWSAAGVVTAAAVDADRVTGVEEPVTYHDDGEQRGAYRLRLFD